MRFVVFLLSLVAGLSAIGTLFLGTMTVMRDNPLDPTVPWGYALLAGGCLVITLSVLGALLIWATPSTAEKLLWLGALAGVSTMGFYGALLYITRDYPNAPDLRMALKALPLTGLVPAIATAVAAVLTRRFVIRKMI